MVIVTPNAIATEQGKPYWIAILSRIMFVFECDSNRCNGESSFNALLDMDPDHR